VYPASKTLVTQDMPAAPAAKAPELKVFGHEIRVNANGLLCLTDLWKAAGGKEEERPTQWLRRVDVADFVSTVVSNLVGHQVYPKPQALGRSRDMKAIRNRAEKARAAAEKHELLSLMRGRYNGGTFAH